VPVFYDLYALRNHLEEQYASARLEEIRLRLKALLEEGQD
jgi:hypothetical protein